MLLLFTCTNDNMAKRNMEKETVGVNKVLKIDGGKMIAYNPTANNLIIYERIVG